MTKARAAPADRVRAAKTVVVQVSGSPRSVASLLWTMQQGRLDAKVVYWKDKCEGKKAASPITESYVRALAKALDLTFLGTRHLRLKDSVTVSGYSGTDGKYPKDVTPYAGRSEEDALALLDRVGVRPHPGITLGVRPFCDAKKLEAAAVKKQTTYETALAAAIVLSGDFPSDLALYDAAEIESRAGRPPTATAVPQEPVAPPAAPSRGKAPPVAPKPARRRKLAKGHSLLFSYGSNSPRRLAERLGRPVEATRGFLRDWKRVFVGHSENWGGAPATMVPSRGDVVFGTLVDVTEADLAKLDRYEGAPRVYQRKTVDIEGPDLEPVDQGTHKAVVYLATSTKTGKPSAAYMKAIEENVSSVWETQAQRRKAAPIPRKPLTIPEDMEEIATGIRKNADLDAFEEAMLREQKKGPLDYIAWMKRVKNADEGRIIHSLMRDEIHDIIARSGLKARSDKEEKRDAHVSHFQPNWPHSFPEKDPGHAQARGAWKRLIKEVTDLSPKDGARLAEVFDEDRIGPHWKKAYDAEPGYFGRGTYHVDREAYGKKIEALAAKTKDFRELMKLAKDRIDAIAVVDAWGHAFLSAIPKDKKSRLDYSPRPKGGKEEMAAWLAALAKIPNAAVRARALELAGQYPGLVEMARALGDES